MGLRYCGRTFILSIFFHSLVGREHILGMDETSVRIWLEDQILLNNYTLHSYVITSLSKNFNSDMISSKTNTISNRVTNSMYISDSHYYKHNNEYRTINKSISRENSINKKTLINRHKNNKQVNSNIKGTIKI